jgi:hypothetical protein
MAAAKLMWIMAVRNQVPATQKITNQFIPEPGGTVPKLKFIWR